MATRRMPRGVVIFWVVLLLVAVAFTALLFLYPDSNEGVGLGLI
jgi:hypothetical protein